MAVWYVAIITYIWDLFNLWVNTLFVTPFTTADMLWLLVPVWASWFFAEFFQEKTGTSFGNAITNSVVVLWGSIDCTRQTLRLMADNIITGAWDIFSRCLIIGLVFVYGVIIIVWAWKTNKRIKYLGRVREVTYVFAIFTPIFYNALPLTWDHLIAAVLFFPLFYFAIELLDRYTPNPQAIIEDMNETSQSSNASHGALGAGAPSRPQQPQAHPQQYQYRPPQPHPGAGAAYPQRPQQPQQPQQPRYPPANPYNPYNRGPGQEPR